MFQFTGRSIFTTLLIISASWVHAQDSTTIYFTENWKETTADSAFYYRKAWQDHKGGGWQVRDYYSTGELQMTGAVATSLEDDLLTGLCTCYHINGRKSSEGKYKRGLHEGLWSYWFDDGTLNQTETYKDDSLDGPATYYYTNGNVSAKETYRNGALLTAKYYTEDGKPLKMKKRPVLHPQYPGGLNELNAFLSNNLKYPDRAREDGIEGRVIVSFVVSQDGVVSEIKVKKKVHPLLDAEAIRVAGMMPVWTRGFAHNRPFKVYFTLPVTFRLD